MKYPLLLLIFLVAFTASHDSIKVGSVLSSTGYASLYGENSQKGIMLAVEEINEQGGINGRPIEVIFEDDTTNGKTAVTAATKLIEQDKVNVIIGGTWDLSVDPIVPVAEHAKVVFITPSTGNTAHEVRLSPYLFRTWTSIESKVYAFKPIFEEKKIKRVVMFRNGGTWALGHKLALDRLLNETGGELMSDFEGVQVDGNDFATQIVQAKELAPDAAFLAVNNGDAVSIMKKFKELDFSPIVFGTDGGLEDAIRTGQVPITDVHEAYLIDPLSNNADFVHKFEQKYGKSPGITADAAYLAMKLVADAYRSGATDGESIRAYLDSSGTFDAYGDIRAKDTVYSVVNGTQKKFSTASH